MSPRNLFTYEMRRTSAIIFSIEVLLETYGGPKSVQNHIYASRHPQQVLEGACGPIALLVLRAHCQIAGDCDP